MSARPLPQTEREIPNIQVQGTASSFADGAIYLYDHREVHQSWPSVLLLGSLSIELYLKSHISTTVSTPTPEMPDIHELSAAPMSKNARDHRLSELFDLLDPQDQDRLQSAYALAPCVEGLPLLRDALARYCSIFVEIRYSYEGISRMIPDVDQLIGLVRFFQTEIAGMSRRIEIRWPT